MTFLCSVLTGCIKINEIQSQAYAVGIGIDYVNDEYYVILQFLDFSNVAKSEQGKNTEPSPVWISEGKGKTVSEAITNIYEGIQVPVNYDQISLCLFSESILDNRIEEALEFLDTNFNIRLTAWVYGTANSISKIFTTKLPFYYAFSYSRLVQPQYMQQQNSTIPSISLQELIYMNNEDTKTLLLPSISIDDVIIKEDLKQIPVTVFNGAYIMKGTELKGHLTKKEIEGYIRVNNESVRSTLMVVDGEKESGKFIDIELLNPKVKRKIIEDDDTVRVGLDIKVSTVIRESRMKVLAPKVKKEVKEKIRNDVYSAYLKSREMGGDIYQFEDYLYRFWPKEWWRLQTEGELPILNKEDVHVEIKPFKSINRVDSGIDAFLK